MGCQYQGRTTVVATDGSQLTRISAAAAGATACFRPRGNARCTSQCGMNVFDDCSETSQESRIRQVKKMLTIHIVGECSDNTENPPSLAIL